VLLYNNSFPIFICGGGGSIVTAELRLLKYITFDEEKHVFTTCSNNVGVCVRPYRDGGG